jgi:hypothetical protein
VRRRRRALSESPNPDLAARTGFPSPADIQDSRKALLISSLEDHLPNRGVRRHIEVPCHFRAVMIVSQGLSAGRNRDEISAKPSAHSGVRNNMELAQLGF